MTTASIGSMRRADDRNVAVHRLLRCLGFRCEARLSRSGLVQGRSGRHLRVLRRSFAASGERPERRRRQLCAARLPTSSPACHPGARPPFGRWTVFGSIPPRTISHAISELEGMRPSGQRAPTGPSATTPRCSSRSFQNRGPFRSRSERGRAEPRVPHLTVVLRARRRTSADAVRSVARRDCRYHEATE